jgi:hypothetical protein
MTTPIHFTSDFGLNSTINGVEFNAIDDGRLIVCVITEEALAMHFNAVRHGMRSNVRAFEENREDIQAVAAAMIRGGRVKADGVLLIKAADVEAYRATKGQVK